MCYLFYVWTLTETLVERPGHVPHSGVFRSLEDTIILGQNFPLLLESDYSLCGFDVPKKLMLHFKEDNEHEDSPCELSDTQLNDFRGILVLWLLNTVVNFELDMELHDRPLCFSMILF